MNDSIMVSVCMATYNGSAYVGEQLDSILTELEPHDEVVVVDDASSDETTAIIEAIGDARVRLVRQHSNRGYVATFERALNEASGDVMFLADQDDVWVPGRRSVLVAATSGGGVAASNLVRLDTGEPLKSPITRRPWLLVATSSRHRVRNELRILTGITPYFGCAIAVSRGAMALVTPFPEYLYESHDLWIATVANAAGRLVHVEQPTVQRRIHGGNATPERPRGLWTVLQARVLLLRLLFEARRRSRSM